MTSDLALQLLDDYNSYLSKTSYWRQLPIKRLRSPSPANLKAMKSLGDWCTKHAVDPRDWLLSLFARKHWGYAPKWNELRSERHLEAYRTNGNTVSKRFRAKQVQDELAASKAPSTYDPNRDLTATVENNKRFRLDHRTADDCMHAVQETLGYHPRSLVCARCPVATACAERLTAMMPFDIMALRRGEISSTHARDMALLYGNRS